MRFHLQKMSNIDLFQIFAININLGSDIPFDMCYNMWKYKNTLSVEEYLGFRHSYNMRLDQAVQLVSITSTP